MEDNRCVECVFSPVCEDEQDIEDGGRLCSDFVSTRCSLGKAIQDDYTLRINAALDAVFDWLRMVKKGGAMKLYRLKPCPFRSGQAAADRWNARVGENGANDEQA